MGPPWHILALESTAEDIINMLAGGDDDEGKPENKQDFLHPVGNAIAKLTGQTHGFQSLQS
jgi:hypothetical protein